MIGSWHLAVQVYTAEHYISVSFLIQQVPHRVTQHWHFPVFDGLQSKTKCIYQLRHAMNTEVVPLVRVVKYVVSLFPPLPFHQYTESHIPIRSHSII